MDLFIRNIPSHTTRRRLEKCLEPHLKDVQIFVFHCEKHKGKTGTITIFDRDAALKFLASHGLFMPPKPISLLGCRLSIAQDRKNSPSSMIVNSLRDEQMQYMDYLRKNPSQHSSKEQKEFQVETLENGILEYTSGGLAFSCTYRDQRAAKLILGKKELLVRLCDSTRSHEWQVRIKYDSIFSITTSKSGKPAAIMSLDRTPTFFEKISDDNELVELVSTMALNMGLPGAKSPSKAVVNRVCGLDEKHALVAGICLVYRLTFVDPLTVRELTNTLDTLRNAPIHQSAIIELSPSHTLRKFSNELTNLNTELTDLSRHGSLPFGIKFQLLRLVYNGFLSPHAVLQLLEPVSAMRKRFSEIAITEAVRIFARNLPIPDPSTSATASDFRTATILSVIERNAQSFRLAGSVYEHVKRHGHLALVHKVVATPCGVYLEGPELETKNRVLRKYPQHTDCFIRVQLADEDWQPLREESDVSTDALYTLRYTKFMNSSLTLCGRAYSFLGFSHSSLRDHQCWFMARFWSGNMLMLPELVIEDLGNFDTIRSPAKCAARIGQAFSDTTESIPLERSWIERIPDIERNGRCFTDGVGTISPELLRDVWAHFTRTKKESATVLQIRHAGAKGMVSLDYSLPGRKICLRPSMIKFEGSSDLNLEICGAGFRRLPMYLNRPLIKILEDLGVNPEGILDLQATAVQQLATMTKSPKRAARYLEANSIGLGARLPSLVRSLSSIGLSFRDDDFLRQTVDVAALMQLRNMKYRARIPVPNGHTLLGVADTTGILDESEVYIPISFSKEETTALEGSVLVTRSPALHPGDIQMVKAVQVPEICLLRGLHNCIVFSTKGRRDLPSCLSGGDLDGDLYNIILDKGLWPQKLHSPADYPRPKALDIGRKVQSRDITKFFLEFMRTDILGLISTRHLIVADQKPDGVLDPTCIKLAEMASTAVDYSKTGISVPIADMPQDYDRRCKPDFMYTGPRLHLEHDIQFESDQKDFDEPDPTTEFGIENRPTRYYRTEKVLGQLYRAIDEVAFLKDARYNDQVRSRIGDQSARSIQEPSLIEQLKRHVDKNALLVPWRDQISAMRDLRQMYEDALLETMWQYSTHQSLPLTEVEVFCGVILGRNGEMPSKRARESNIKMKEKFDRDVSHVIRQIRHNDDEAENLDFNIDVADVSTNTATDSHNNDNETSPESLARSMACFYLGVTEPGSQIDSKSGNLKSWLYVAAAVCLQEINRSDSNIHMWSGTALPEVRRGVGIRSGRQMNA